MWLLSLPDDSLTTWADIYNKFMTKFYSPQKTSALRQKLATFAQQEGEPFHEAWECFKMLQVECPHHHYPAELLNQFFYDGLTQKGQCLVDSAAGGSVGSKTSAEIFELYEMLGANSQQKSTRTIRRVGAAEANVTQDLAVQVCNLTDRKSVV